MTNGGLTPAHPRRRLTMGFKITCPECEATLNLAKAIAPGKKMKCPRCAAVFVVPRSVEESDEEPEPPRKKAAAQKVAPGITKSPAAKASADKPPPAPPSGPAPKMTTEDEESAGIYGIQQTEAEDKQAEEKKPKIDYAPDLTVKDPRGAAVEKVARASNALLLIGSGSFFLGLAVFAVGLWPFVFADYMLDPKMMQTVFKKLDALKQ